ncbi:MAG: alanine dehydrogenase [Ignavibacteriae bacterium]|nr:MAG: alanine dehydrogenase [Ignavibacteriota bacterium]
MRIGIPKETLREEKRVGLTPVAVNTLVKSGHTVFIETKAGQGSHFSDQDYIDAGATIVYSPEEVYQRAELIAKVTPLTDETVELVQENQIIFSFLHLAVGKKNVVDHLIKKKATAIGYEFIEKDGMLPVLHSISEIAGQLSVQVGSKYLKSDIPNGRGILMGGIPGVAPAAVVILGAGVVGLNAARAAYATGAQVIVLDSDIKRLRRIERYISKNITTVVSNPMTVARGVKFADLLIGAVQVMGAKSPHVVTEEMVKTMKKGSVIVDVAIDQGGCIETSYPTTISDPVFIKHDVIHYCVPNIPAIVARTSSYGITNSAINYILNIADNGLANTLLSDTGLSKGVCTHNGTCSNEVIADTFELEYRRLHIFSTN